MNCDEFEYIDYQGIRVKAIYCGTDLHRICATDIAHHFKKSAKDFNRTTFMHNIAISDYETYKGKGGGTYYAPYLADILIAWCKKHPYTRYLRDEEKFFSDLSVLLSIIPITIPLVIYQQYPVLNYYLDGYIPGYNLVIEFDDEHHIKHKEEDKKREQDIKDFFSGDITFIRIDRRDYEIGKAIILMFLLNPVFSGNPLTLEQIKEKVKSHIEMTQKALS